MPKVDLQGKWSIVTGASSGIGREMAKLLAQAGSHLVITARRAERLQELAQEIQAKYPVKVEVITEDLSLPGSAHSLMSKAQKLAPRFHVLINNAGVGQFGKFHEVSLSTHLSIIQLNITTPTELGHLFVQGALGHREKSYLLNVSSVVGVFSLPYYALYCSTKHYLRHLSLNMREEMASTPIKVSCLCPGRTATEFAQTAGERDGLPTQSMGMSAHQAALIGLQGLWKEEAMIVPGLSNKLVCLVMNFIPQSFLSKVAMTLMK